MAKMSPLMLAAFPAEKQKGPKVSASKRGERARSETDQQHGEMANAEEPRRARSDKPKQMSHSSKAMIAPPYTMGTSELGKPAKKVSPKEAVEHEAHYAKVQATRDWVSGRITTKEHDATHRRANEVLKHHGKRP